MGYLHIDNLYKNQEILLFKECYALEKIHGTSANIRFDGEKQVAFSSGGEKHERFIKLFDEAKLTEKFKELFNEKVIVFGEAYGGKCQGMNETYGVELKFVAFDVKVGDCWLDVPNAFDVCDKLGLEFVSFNKVKTNLKELDKQRDLPSIQAYRNGFAKSDKIREGVVLRPLIEVKKNNGSRIICKHKRDEFLETATKREVSPEQLKVLEEANAIATEWVTPMRLNHVLDKVDFESTIENTGKVIKAMLEDIHREAKGEILESNLADRTIGRLTAKLFKNKITSELVRKENLKGDLLN